MPLKGVPASLTPELLFALARMGHGDRLVVADANFPSDSIATRTVLRSPVRVYGRTTVEIARDVGSLACPAIFPSRLADPRADASGQLLAPPGQGDAAGAFG